MEIKSWFCGDPLVSSLAECSCLLCSFCPVEFCLSRNEIIRLNKTSHFSITKQISYGTPDRHDTAHFENFAEREI